MGRWEIGTSNIKDIYIDTGSMITHYIGKKVESKIFGIPLAFSDYITTELMMEQNPNNFELESEILLGKRCKER